MRLWFALATLLLFVSPASLRAAEAEAATRMIDAGGLKLRAQVTGQAREGQPTVVLVGGLGDSLEIWKAVQPEVAKTTRVVAYDRAGLGQSEADSQPLTPQRVAAQLHTLLRNAGIQPPYVLVGHSLGSLFVRMFTGLYPGEVAGLVFLDPSDFTQTREEQMTLWKDLGRTEADLKERDKQVQQQWEGLPPAVRAEAQLSFQMGKSGFADFHALPPLPAIPMVVLAAGQIEMPPAEKAIFSKYRIPSLTRMATLVPDGTLVLTTRSGHYIQTSEPELVTWAVRRVLDGAAKGGEKSR